MASEPAPSPLPDGTYDAIVVDAREIDADTQVIELTVLAGEHKGQVLELRGARGTADPIDLLGIPATIEVTGGRPAITLEP